MSERLPLLLFPHPSTTQRDGRRPNIPRVHLPTAGRQGARLGPKFTTLQAAFDTRSIQLQANAPQDDPELVVVFETIGPIASFIGAVRRIPGLEWLLEADEHDVEPDDDFFDEEDRSNLLRGSLFLLGTNRQALAEVVNLWTQYQQNPAAPFRRGLGKWKDVFKHLRDVRFWGAKDRLGRDIIEYWNEHLSAGAQTIRFEIEAWCFETQDKNQHTNTEVRRLVAASGGQVLLTALIPDIAYHGFLVELPANGVRALLDESPPELVLSERVMFFRPRGQAVTDRYSDDLRIQSSAPPAQQAKGAPIVALLDGLPLQNHPLLTGRLAIDDPDGWEANYPAAERNHGTAMASLIALGELDGSRAPLRKPIYVRPIMRPDPASFGVPRAEATPSDSLLVDLIHRSVRRIFEGEGAAPAAAPSVKVINLSVAEAHREFDRALSPWARLLDWLAFRYRVLFIVSAGNGSRDLTLETPKGSLAGLTQEQRQRLAAGALFSDSTQRRLLAPAEAINAITVGAVHADMSAAPVTPNRYDLFPPDCVAPYSRIGHGFRRSIKPDIVLPGGRALYSERLVGPTQTSQVGLVSTRSAPGQRVAAPPNAGGTEVYTRGTSNASALASRGAANAHDVIEALRAGRPELLPGQFDSVLLKALLTHGAEWGDLEHHILNARPDIDNRAKQQSLVARFVGYGLADIERAINCTEQRATLIGVGELINNQAMEFRAPLPPCLIAQTTRRRLTVTLAWLSPVSARNSRYRTARLWISPPKEEYGVSRTSYQWQHVLRGTVQHEILEGGHALPFIDGAEVVFKVNCSEDAGPIPAPVPFALCVTLEVAEGIALPIYQEIRDRVAVQVAVQP